MPYLWTCAQNGRDYIICGDRNIAHKTIDLKNWCGNQKTRAFCRKKEPNLISYLLIATDWMPLDLSTRKPSNTPGGQTGAKPGQKTSAGALITRSSAQRARTK
jgi:hypothetical protein